MTERISRGQILFGDARFTSGHVVRTHAIEIDSTPTGAEQDTGWDLPAESIVLGVVIDVDTAEATGGTPTLDVGLLSSESGGDADGFIDGASVTATGKVQGTVTATVGGSETYLSACTVGALLRAAYVAGSDVATDHGIFVPRMHLTGTARSVTYTAGSNDFAEFRGRIIIIYADLQE
jgi:hypothetical protein